LPLNENKPASKFREETHDQAKSPSKPEESEITLNGNPEYHSIYFMENNNYFIELSKSIPLIILFIFSLKLAGLFARKRFPDGLISHPGLDTFNGLLLVVFITSIFISGIFTSLAIIPFYFIIGYNLKNGKSQRHEANGWTDSLLISLFYLFYISYSLFFTFRGVSKINMPYIDEYFYIQVSKQIDLYRKETNDYRINWGNLYDVKSIYHYFEIWLSLTLSKIKLINPMFSFRYGTYPIFLAISSFLFYKSYSDRINKSILFLVALLLPVLGSYATFEMLDFSYLPHTLRINLTYLSDYVPANRLKLSVLLLLFSVVFFLFHQKEKFYFVPLILAIFFWPLTAHSVGSGFLTFLLFSNIKKFDAIKISIVFSLTTLAFFFLAVYNPAGQSNNYDFQSSILKYRSFKIIAGTIIYDLLAFSISILPFFIILIRDRKQTFYSIKSLILGIAGSILIASATNAATIGNIESFQFFINLAAPLISLILGASLIYLFENFNSKFTVPFLFFFLFYQVFAFGRIFYNNCQTFNLQYSSAYTEFLKKIRTHSWRGISIIKPDGYFKGVPHLNQTGSFIYFFDKSCVTPVNNAENIPLASQEGIKKMNVDGPFLKFVTSSGSSDTVRLRDKFILEQRINFLVVAKEKSIKEYPDLEMKFRFACKDPVSGEKLYLLRKQENP
jgi:hypothetical protein